jgi:S-adenosylmethionine:tRNA ribosyltransferase-isomerase
MVFRAKLYTVCTVICLGNGEESLELRLNDFDYELPEELIAQKPMEKRDESRLLVYHRDTRLIEHRIFKDITEYLKPGDCLVLNDTRVIPARLLGEKAGTGGRMEFVLLSRVEGDTWRVLVKPGKRAKVGNSFVFGNGLLKAEVISVTEEGGRLVRFYYRGIFEEILDKVGMMPLPPYIHEKLKDKERYQTVYAIHQGSVAAPTAGLHFTPELLDKIRDMGVITAKITLHVGIGTFRPVKAEDITAHKMHEEIFEITREAADTINKAKEAGGRIIAIGTTTTRTLESTADNSGRISHGHGGTSIFIYPGYRFRATDALITNFHLPKSTLIMLISALAGREEVLEVYREAVRKGYRFFSFGDAMLIL